MIPKNFQYIIRRFLSVGMILVFGLSSLIGPVAAQGLPLSGSATTLASPVHPPVLLGMKIHPENPFLFDFLVDRGNSQLSDEEFKRETEKLVNYFLAALTIPDKEVWVNLSPAEKDRIIPDTLGRTNMGKTMLEQDYLLKQMSASLSNPEEKLGQTFWKKVQAVAGQDIPMSTFNKVWIVPGMAKVLESDGIVVINDKYLKVLMADDYIAQRSQRAHFESQKAVSQNSSDIFRATILPEIEKEVNAGKNFASVRQVYNSVILAAWYKQALKESLLGRIYADKAKTAGVETDDKNIKQKIYEQYLAAFKKGAYNLIKEEEDEATGEIIPRKYFSGGLVFDASAVLGIEKTSSASIAQKIKASSQVAEVVTQLAETGGELTVVSQNVVTASSSATAQIKKTLDSGALLFEQLNKYGNGVFQDDYLKNQFVSPLDLGKRRTLARVLFQYIYWRVATSQGTSLTDQEWLQVSQQEPLKSLLRGQQLQLTKENIPLVLAALTFQKEGLRYSNQALIGTMFEDIKIKGLRSASSVLVNKAGASLKQTVEDLSESFDEGSISEMNDVLEGSEDPKVVLEQVRLSQLTLAELDREWVNFVDLNYDFFEGIFQEDIREKIREQGTQGILTLLTEVVGVTNKNNPSQIIYTYPSEKLGMIFSEAVFIYVLNNMTDEEKQIETQRQDTLRLLLRELMLRSGYAPKARSIVETLVPMSGLTQDILDRVIKPVFNQNKSVRLSNEVEVKAFRELLLSQLWENNLRQEADGVKIIGALSTLFHAEPKYLSQLDDLVREISAALLKQDIYSQQEQQYLSAKAAFTTTVLLTVRPQVAKAIIQNIPNFDFLAKDVLEYFLSQITDVQDPRLIYFDSILESNPFILDYLYQQVRNYLSKPIELNSYADYGIAAVRKYLTFLRPEIFRSRIQSFSDSQLQGINDLSAEVENISDEELGKKLLSLQKPQLNIPGIETDSVSSFPNLEKLLVPGSLFVMEIMTDMKNMNDMLKNKTTSSSSIQEVIPSVNPAVSTPVGGIDFDPSQLNLQIKRNGKGVPLPLPQQDLDHLNIEGLYPVIINILPVNDQTLPVFLGQTDMSGRTPALAGS